MPLRPPLSQRGFSMIEMIMVIVIASILAAVAMVKWPSDADLRPQARQLAQDLRQARTLAMNRGSCSLVRTSATTYAFSGCTPLSPPRPLSNVAITAPFTVTFNRLGEATTGDAAIGVSAGGTTVTVNVTGTTGMVSIP